MKIRSVLAAFAAFAMMLGGMPSIKMSSSGGIESISLTPAAYAKGKKGERIWMDAGSSQEDIMAVINAGNEACVGAGKLYTCYTKDTLANQLLGQQVSRVDGLGKNVGITSIIALAPDGTILRDEHGAAVVTFRTASEQQNAAAVWNTGLANIPAAAFNGVGAAAVQAAFPACRGGSGCGGSTGVTTIVNAGAVSNSALSAAISGGSGSCSTCGVTPPVATDPHH